MIRPLTLIIALLALALAPAFAQDFSTLRWNHELEHFTHAEGSAYDAWIITPPAAGGAKPHDFATIVDSIFQEPQTRIAHIFLGDLVRRPEFQKPVMDYVAAQPEFRQHPPPVGFGRWEFKNSKKMRYLVEQGLLRSPFATSCNVVLGPHGKMVGAVSMEKLFFTKKDGQWAWDAMVYLIIDPPPK